MIDFRPIFLVIGYLLCTLALAMCVPAVVDAVAGHADWQVFAASASVTLFVGVALVLTCRTGTFDLSIRQAFVLTTATWVALTVFAALPLAFSELDMSFTDAFFEAMSGLTTTGSTVMTGLDFAPPGILLWRALLQWLGGVGIIVMAIAVLPFLKVGGMQFFRMEWSSQAEKVRPRAAQVAAVIGIIYVGLTAGCAGALWLAGMSGFDALTHAMTTIATGGYSTHDASLGYYDSATIDAIVTAGMIVGSLPFIIYWRMLRAGPRVLFRDSQVIWFLCIAGGLALMATIWLWVEGIEAPGGALRFAAFNVISVMTGTGYSSTDFGSWGPFTLVLLLFAMFVGGCAGSTTCGIKIFRFQMLYAHMRVQLLRLIQPNGVFIPYWNRQPIPAGILEAVLSFFFIYLLCFAVLAVALGALRLDFVTSVSGAATAISNVGPGLGDVIGPTGTFQPLPDAAKWLLSLGMLLGRLELFTVLVLFTPGFWRG